MSKPYRIRVQDVVSSRDFSTFHVEAIPLMPPSEFADLLAQVLLEAGWECGENGHLSMEVDEEMSYMFDSEKMKILTIVSGEEHIDQTLEGWSPDVLEDQGKELMNQREKKLTQEMTRKLEETCEQRRVQCEQWVVEATGRAIKEAAERLGDVQTIQEDRDEDGRYRLSITIEERS